jgi:hypothetical protein
MNYEVFETFGPDANADESSSTRPLIPQSSYKPVKRCPNCQSVYLTDTQCEACGRSLLYHPVGEPFSAKSLYGFKERHYGSFSFLVKYYPIFENKKSEVSRSYIRNLIKRFDDLLLAFGEPDAIATNNRRLFYVEMLELMDELLRYGMNPHILQQKIEARDTFTGPLLTQELIYYLRDSQLENKLGPSWQELLVDHRVMGLKINHWVKVMMITATIVIMAVSYYSLISSQVGK